MARALFWEPSRVPEQVKGVGNPDDTLKSLIETCGRDPEHPLCPVELGPQHIFMLKELGKSTLHSLYSELATLIKTHGRIRLWGKN